MAADEENPQIESDELPSFALPQRSDRRRKRKKRQNYEDVAGFETNENGEAAKNFDTDMSRWHKQPSDYKFECTSRGTCNSIPLNWSFESQTCFLP